MRDELEILVRVCSGRGVRGVLAGQGAVVGAGVEEGGLDEELLVECAGGNEAVVAVRGGVVVVVVVVGYQGGVG